MSRPLGRNRYVIMYQAAEFCPNLSRHRGNVTSYIFFKMAAAAAQNYFQFRICWCLCLPKVKIYHYTKFRRHNQFTAEILLLQVSKKCPPYWNSTSGFDPDQFAVICMLFCISLLNFVHIGALIAEIWRQYLFIKMAATTDKYYFRIRICWCHCLQMVKVYQETKFHRHISIYGSDITTSVFEKQTSAILEFYFRFRSRPFSRNLHFILHQPTEFRPNRSSHSGNITSYRFIKMAPRRLNTTSGFVSVDVTAFRRLKSISKPNSVEISQMAAEI